MSDTTDLQFSGFGIANYRSFDEEGFFIDQLSKINVFIGKNNSGKSNIIRAIRLLKRITKPKMPQGQKSGYDAGLCLKPEIDSHARNGAPPTVTVGIPFGRLIGDHPLLIERFTAQAATPLLRVKWNTATGAADQIPGLDGLDDKALIQFHNQLTGTSYMGRPRREQMLSDVVAPLVVNAVGTLRSLDRLVCVESFREIREVKDPKPDEDAFSGYNVIAELHKMQHPDENAGPDRRIFDKIQEFVRGLVGGPDLSMEVPHTVDKILIEMHGNRLPLASYGTGVHQLVILCAALAMHENYIVCIEEPEIHMHPELQRKFLRFIANETNNRYFITTHSNVFLDLLPDVALYHVTHDGQKSTVKHIEATPAARNVLADLGYKASDLLQANCVIWVEGPSDRIYLNKWLSLVATDLIETVHYAVMYYGGKVLAHFTAVDDPEDDLVQVLRINRYAIFLMDRDDVEDGGKLNATKERILEEVGEEQCWVTEGREIENYLRPELIDRYLTDKCGQTVNIKFTSECKLQEAINAATKDLDVTPVNHTKVEYARAFCELMDMSELDVLDLSEKLNQMVDLIREWNHMDAE